MPLTVGEFHPIHVDEHKLPVFKKNPMRKVCIILHLQGTQKRDEISTQLIKREREREMHTHAHKGVYLLLPLSLSLSSSLSRVSLICSLRSVLSLFLVIFFSPCFRVLSIFLFSFVELLFHFSLLRFLSMLTVIVGVATASVFNVLRRFSSVCFLFSVPCSSFFPFTVCLSLSLLSPALSVSYSLSLSGDHSDSIRRLWYGTWVSIRRKTFSAERNTSIYRDDVGKVKTTRRRDEKRRKKRRRGGGGSLCRALLLARTANVQHPSISRKQKSPKHMFWSRNHDAPECSLKSITMSPTNSAATYPWAARLEIHPGALFRISSGLNRVGPCRW